MGVVTDVTVKGLTTAVTNISATGMSDTTGQAIVTSINNLRGATSPIITDDTGQDIKTAINALANAISPAASNVTFDNTGTQWSASNMQALGAEIGSAVKVIRSTAVSATTNGNGNITTSLNTADYIVLGLVLETTSAGYFVLNSYNGKIVLHITDSTGASLGNTAISGTLYLLKISDLTKLLV